MDWIMGDLYPPVESNGISDYDDDVTVGTNAKCL